MLFSLLKSAIASNARGTATAFALAALAASAVPHGARAQEANGTDVVATLNGEPITERDLEMTLSDLQEQLGQVPEEGRRAAALTALIDIRMLADKAQADGLGDDEEFLARLDFLRQRALHNAYFKQEVVDKVTDADVRARYDREVAATPPENEVRARHILVETEEEAKALIAELDGGADFETLAKEKSTGPSGPAGGDLGYFTKGRMVPEFEAAAFALDAGAYTKEPVKSDFGWHVIKVEDRRQVQPPSYAEVEAQIRSVLLRERYFELLSAMRAEADLEVADPELDAALKNQETSAQ